MVGIQRQRLLVIFDGLGEVALLVLDDAEVVECLGIVRVELDRLFERLGSLVELA